MFVIETTFVKKTCQKAINRCFNRPDYKYVQVENEITNDPHWPPVSQSGQTIYQRLDSRYQAPCIEDQTNLVSTEKVGTKVSPTITRTMIVDKETRQIRQSPEFECFSEGDVVQSDEIMLMSDENDERGLTNPSLHVTSGDTSEADHKSTQL